MKNITEVKNEFEGKEFTILKFYNSIRVDYGVDFFKDELYNDIKTKGKTQVVCEDNQEIYTIFAEIKEDTDCYGSIIKITKIELVK